MSIDLICPGWNGHSHKMFIAQGGRREWQIEKINGDVTNNLGNTFTTYLSLLANLHKCIPFIPCWSLWQIMKPNKVYSTSVSTNPDVGC